MNKFHLLLALVGMTFGLPASAADLSKIERRIAKEPVYQSKPTYCLLVFGPDAKTHAWLVLDGDVLYVDRNGNGDLTEEGERIDTKQRLGLNAGFGILFDAGAITEPGNSVRHTDLVVRRVGFASSAYTVSVTVEGKRRQYAGIDDSGCLLFADQPHKAPIIHFGGPLAMKLLPVFKPTFRRGDKPSNLTAVIGTPGYGAGTLAMLLYDDASSPSVPSDTHPLAEIEFAAQGDANRPLGRPVTIKVALTSRC